MFYLCHTISNSYAPNYEEKLTLRQGILSIYALCYMFFWRTVKIMTEKIFILHRHNYWTEYFDFLIDDDEQFGIVAS